MPNDRTLLEQTEGFRSSYPDRESVHYGCHMHDCHHTAMTLSDWVKSHVLDRWCMDPSWTWSRWCCDTMFHTPQDANHRRKHACDEKDDVANACMQRYHYSMNTGCSWNTPPQQANLFSPSECCRRSSNCICNNSQKEELLVAQILGHNPNFSMVANIRASISYKEVGSLHKSRTVNASEFFAFVFFFG